MNLKPLLMMLALGLPGGIWAAPTITGGSRSIEWPKPADAVETSVTVTGTNVSSVLLFVDTGSGFVSTPMVLDSGNVWKLTIPGTGSLANGSYVKYYIEATDDTGTGDFPVGAPTNFQVFLVDETPAGADDLVINELMYDPTGTDNGGWPEFVEFYNRRSTPIRLDYFTVGRSLTDATPGYVFPPNTEIAGNGYLVLAGNLTNFNAHYADPGVPVLDWGKVASFYNNTAGVATLTHVNTIGFESALGTPFDQVPYKNSLPWPGGRDTGGVVTLSPNNGGPSIELVNPGLDNSVGDNWKTSTLLLGDRSRGTPGAQNSTYSDFALNVSQVTRDIQYPSTTDTIQISANVVGPNTVTEVKVVADTGDGAGFHDIGTLSNGGSGDTYQGPIGPFGHTTDIKYFVEATDSSNTTAGLPDNAPTTFNVFEVNDHPVGASDVVINEIMYDPPGADNSLHSEWVELYNRDNVDLNLSFFQFSPRDTGYAQVIIPEGTTITANGYLLLVGRTDLFTTDYPDLNTSQVINCNWIGINVLEDGTTGDDPNLRHVNAIGYTGTPGAVFDKVPYLGAAPWPSPDPGAGANGGGQTIELTDPSLDNSKAISWNLSDVNSAPTGTPLARNSMTLSGVGDWSIF